MTLSENKRILYKPENSDALIYKLHEIQNNNKDVTNDDEKIDPAELKKFFKKIIDHDKYKEVRKKTIIKIVLNILATFFVIIIFLMGITIIYCLVTQIQEIESRNLSKDNESYSRNKSNYLDSTVR